MPVILSPNAKQQFFTDGSTVAAGYRLHTLAANTPNPQATYANRAGTVENPNPIILDARGEATIYLTPGITYDYVLKTDQGATVWTQEDVAADAGDADAVVYTPPSTGVSGSIRTFLDQLWDPDAAAGSSLVRFLQAGSGAEARTVQEKLYERVSVLDFIPQAIRTAVINGTNTVDLTAYIQTAVESRPGKYIQLLFPSHSYRVDGTVTIKRNNIRLTGEKAEILHNNTTDSCFDLGDNLADYSDCVIEGFLFAKVAVSSAGSIIRGRRFSIVEIRDCLFYGQDRIWKCIDWTVGYQITVKNNFLEKCLDTHCTFRGTGGVTGRCVDIMIYDNRFDYGLTAVYFDVYCEGIFFRRNICLRQVNQTMTAIGSPAWTIASIKVQENDFDGGAAGLTLEYASTAQVMGNWFSSNTGLNISIGANFSNGIFSGNQVYALPGQTCANIAGDNTVWTGNYFSGGQQGYVLAATCTGCTITGNGVNNMTGSAVNLFSNPDRVTVVGNTLLSNSTGVSAGGTNLNVASNLTA